MAEGWGLGGRTSVLPVQRNMLRGCSSIRYNCGCSNAKALVARCAWQAVAAALAASRSAGAAARRFSLLPNITALYYLYICWRIVIEVARLLSPAQRLLRERLSCRNGALQCARCCIFNCEPQTYVQYHVRQRPWCRPGRRSPGRPPAPHVDAAGPATSSLPITGAQLKVRHVSPCGVPAGIAVSRPAGSCSSSSQPTCCQTAATCPERCCSTVNAAIICDDVC